MFWEGIRTRSAGSHKMDGLKTENEIIKSNHIIPKLTSNLEVGLARL